MGLHVPDGSLTPVQKTSFRHLSKNLVTFVYYREQRNTCFTLCLVTLCVLLSISFMCPLRTFFLWTQGLTVLYHDRLSRDSKTIFKEGIVTFCQFPLVQ